jgi:hypothetical protein
MGEEVSFTCGLRFLLTKNSKNILQARRKESGHANKGRFKKKLKIDFREIS